MYWIDNPSTDPAFNLALEAYLLHSIPPGHPGFAILWQNVPTVVVGRFQNTRQEVNADFVRERGIRVVRRLTGGGAVYHDLGTLNYTFIHHLDREGALPSFREAGKPVAEALRSLGLPVAFSGRNDLLLEEYKVAGVAHCRKGRRTLHHGSLLVDTDLDCLAEALRPDPEKFLSKGVASVRGRVGNLAAYLAARVPESPRLTVARVRETVMAHQGGEVYGLSREDTDAVTRLRDEVYATQAWIYGASPPFGERKMRRFPWGRLEAYFEVREGILTSCRFFGDFFSSVAQDALGAAEGLATGQSGSGLGDARRETALANAPAGGDAGAGDGHDLAGLEKALCGVAYTDEAMGAVLRTFSLPDLFTGCDAGEVRAFLLPGPQAGV